MADQLPLRARLVRRAFEIFYTRGAWTYDLVARIISSGHWFGWVAAAAPELRGPVLEIGCGTGHLQLALAHSGVSAVGLDRSPQMLRRTARRLVLLRAPRRLVRGVAGGLPFADRSFASLVATFPADYIIAPATYAEARRVLRPGGRFVIIDGGALPEGRYARAVELIYRLVFGRRGSAPAAPPANVRAELLRAHGFTVSERWLHVGESSVQALLGELTDG